jgi:hypothetical protein
MLVASTCNVDGTRAGDSVRAAVSVRECATDDCGPPPEWLAHRSPRGGVLIATTTSWSTSWHHYSATEGEARGPRGLLEGCRVVTSVASAAAPGGGVTTVVAEHWRRAVGVVWTTVVPTT